MDRCIFAVFLLIIADLSTTNGFVFNKVGRVRKNEVETQRYCEGLFSEATHCPRTLYNLAPKDLGDSNLQRTLTEIREAGLKQFCEQAIGYQQCLIDMSLLVDNECVGVKPVWKEALALLDRSIVFRNVLSEACEGTFGNLEQHLRCFTDYRLIQSITECFRIEYTENGKIECSKQRVQATPDCVEGSDQVLGDIAQFLFEEVVRQQFAREDEGYLDYRRDIE